MSTWDTFGKEQRGQGQLCPLETTNMEYHDEGRTSHWPTRTFRCARCGALHQYKRAFDDIPRQSPCCGAEMGRAHDVDGAPGFVMRTPIREVRHKLRREEREGKRLPAMQRDLNPHFAVV